VQIDAREALQHFQKAAEAGSADALFMLGRLHLGDFDAEGAGGPAGSVPEAEVRACVRACVLGCLAGRAWARGYGCVRGCAGVGE
jgi:hypothetical protein